MDVNVFTVLTPLLAAIAPCDGTTKKTAGGKDSP
jgi:hypothetical protein